MNSCMLACTVALMRLATFYADGDVRFGGWTGTGYVALDACGREVLESARNFLGSGREALDAAEEVLSRGGLPGFGEEEVTLLPPVPDPGKVICVGRNYSLHCEEQGKEVPTDPVIFTKFAASLVGSGAEVVIPPESDAVDFEVELAAVIGAPCWRVDPGKALGHVGGYTVFNDISARDLQARDKQWTRAKSFETFGPMGPHLVTADEISDPGDLRISLDVNGVTMQDASTAQMVVSVGGLVSFVSRIVPLEPGDVIATGTPHGVGAFRDPPIFLGPGDVLSARIENVGTLVNRVVEFPGSARQIR